MNAAFPDPSQVFADPSQVPALQGGDAPGAEPQEPPAGEVPNEQEPVGPPIDLEGSIAHAIEVGCEAAIAATETGAEEFMRFAQGVSFLAAAMKDLQPQPQPMDPAAASLASTAIQADQRHAQALMQTDQRHAQAMAQLAAQREAAAQQANRPTPSQPSARG